MIVCAYVALSLFLAVSVIFIFGEYWQASEDYLYKVNSLAVFIRFVFIIVTILGIIGVATK